MTLDNLDDERRKLNKTGLLVNRLANKL